MNNKTWFWIGSGPIVVLAIHVLGTIAGWYETWWWFDIPMHFLGGFAIAVTVGAILDYFQTKGQFEATWKPLYFAILLMFVGTAAAIWELMEFSFDFFLHTSMQPTILDTMKDICMGFIGGGLSALLIILKKK